MGSTFWVVIGIICVVSILSKSAEKIWGNGGGKKRKALEADLAKVESDLDDALERIVVLEKIVTDGKHTLSREIDDLAS